MVTFSSFVNVYNFLLLMEIHHEAQYEGFIFQILTYFSGLFAQDRLTSISYLFLSTLVWKSDPFLLEWNIYHKTFASCRKAKTISYLLDKTKHSHTL